jgi:hypothetical protein
LGISTTRNVPNYTPGNVSVNDFFVTNPTKVFTYFGWILLSFCASRPKNLLISIVCLPIMQSATFDKTVPEVEMLVVAS